jgi:transposase
VARLDEIPGVGATAAAVIIAEDGVDMTRFPTPAHLSSWTRITVAGDSKQRGHGPAAQETNTDDARILHITPAGGGADSQA